MKNIPSQDVQLKDKCFEMYLSEQQIQQKIAEIAQWIDQEYADKTPILIGVLNGAFRFMADLVKHLQIPVEIGFIKVSSYHGMESGGKVMEDFEAHLAIQNRHIILVEDIIDSGLTAHFLINKFQSQQPASLEFATLLYKPLALKNPVDLKYVCFEIPNAFVVGYGLDYDNLGRELNHIYKLKL
jgi:hypoxanthine phosphoribosyltransferase